MMATQQNKPVIKKDDLTIIEKLYHGQFFDIVRALDKKRSRDIAIKFHNGSEVGPAGLDPEWILQTEERTLSELSHSNVIQFCGIVREEGTDYYGLAIEFLPAGNFERVIERVKRAGKQLPLCLKLRLVSEIADALSYVHGKNVVHTDIKASNIGITIDMHAKLMDFELSDTRRLWRFTVSHTSADILIDNSFVLQFNPRHDIYSFGITMFEIVSEGPPYSKELLMDNEKLREHIVNGGRPDVTEICSDTSDDSEHDTLISLMQWCWDDKLINRPSAQEVSLVLKKLYQPSTEAAKKAEDAYADIILPKKYEAEQYWRKQYHTQTIELQRMEEENKLLEKLLNETDAKQKDIQKGWKAEEIVSNPEKESIVFCTEEFYRSKKDDEDVYPVNDDLTKPRGYTLIINMAKGRPGSVVDQKRMTSLFQQLNYQVIVGADKTKQQILNKLKAVSMDGRLSEHDSIVVFTMAHGQAGEFFDAGNSQVNCHELFEIFESQHCKALDGKPKLFLFQCCRGVRKEYHAKKAGLSDEPDSLGKTSSLGDRVEGYASTHGFQSYRNEISGSRYVNAIWNVFRKDAHDTHILSLLTKVNRRVINTQATPAYTAGGLKTTVQCPQKTDNLQRDFYFFPRKPPAKEEGDDKSDKQDGENVNKVPHHDGHDHQDKEQTEELESTPKKRKIIYDWETSNKVPKWQ